MFPQLKTTNLIFSIYCISSFLCLSNQAKDPPAKQLRSRQIRTQNLILSRLFADYDPNTRPPVRALADHAAIVVTVSIVLKNIVWHKHSAEVDLTLKQEWEDSRLAFHVDHREGIHEVLLPKNATVWKPDTFFVGAQEQAPSIGNKGVIRSRTIIEYSGYIRNEDTRILRINFQSDGAFPIRDVRSIRFALSSAIYSIDDVAYLWANSPPLIQPIQIADRLYAGGGAHYAFEEAEAGECHSIGNFTQSSFSCIELLVHFRGSSTIGWSSVLIPCILLVFLSWFHFWVHPSWSVPRTLSSSVPFLLFLCFLIFLPIESCAWRIWLFICTLFTFLSLIEYFFVIRCYSTINQHSAAALTAQQRHHQFNRPTSDDDGKEGTTTTLIVTQDEPLLSSTHAEVLNRYSATNHLDLVSRIAFPIGFLLALVVFILFYIF
uniref:Neurotransmitter-gated ion-channel ligand-binding domain-containing protein n=1 Tax=Meloidogyne incognita TaxID=6306 RepID=A0A914LVV3_MELIC